MSRLVVVSNRVADLQDTTQTGGLAVAMGDALREAGGLWFGWNGETVPSRTKVNPTIEEAAGVTTIMLPLTTKDYNEYYLGFSNSVLWPLLHYRLDLVDFSANQFKGYKRVNSKYASALMPYLRPDDTIWVHDYHLIPLGGDLRSRKAKHRIGFFLHIPFPPPDILSALPQHTWLARALMAYDLVGFQTRKDLDNFHRYIEREAGGTVDADGLVHAFGLRCRAACFPIGIDVDGFARMAAREAAQEKIRLQVMRQRVLQRQTIIGVDRLDYSKGLPFRFRAFDLLLERYPEHHRAVTFMQIAPPTRTGVEAYDEIRVELETLSGAINGRHADFDWTPLHYIHRSVPRTTLAPLFRFSQVGFVTPLRDGMNLVAKEYVAAQDETDPGVLVLSKFAGAAETMTDALIVNPYDLGDGADTLNRALTMPIEERRERHAALIKVVRDSDISIWRANFLDALRAPCETAKS